MLLNWIKSDKIKLRYIPLFFACLLVTNGLMSILIGIYPYLKEALSLPHSTFLANFISMSTPLKFNVAVLIIFGYLLLLTGRGIYRRLRFFWALALLMLFILLSNSYMIHGLDSMLSCFYLIELLALLFCFQLFDQQTNLFKLSYSQFIVIVSFALALLYGVIGSYMLKDEFNDLKSMTDALYFTIETFSTVGYGDITPVTQDAKLFVVSMIFVGLGAFATILTYVIGALSSRIQDLFKTLNKGKKHMKNHIIICGYNVLTQIIINQCQKDETPFLIVEENIDDPLLQELDQFVVKGNASVEVILEKASIDKARSIILAYEKDADNILALLTVADLLKEKNLNTLKVITRINQKSNIRKAKSLGAQSIISPLVMAASEMMQKAL
ncbi:NAD-binding protein [Thiotrichales bacterium 19S3-7]|nr:NAD-binding protein [Thiotrichales bacterium 19S3-7]MCF6801937.1 NAD-binding protein [Thiotrichales bacterium 19S3-11]